jgi:hypothetical protein
MFRESESSSGAARARRMTASSAASPMQPNQPRTAPLSTAVIAPEDVEHPVGRRREAHAVAPGGAGAGWGQRRPGVGRWAEAVHVVETVACGGQRGARLHPQARALRAAAGALWPQVRRAAGRSQACQARPSCILGADPGRAPRLPGEAEGGGGRGQSYRAVQRVHAVMQHSMYLSYEGLSLHTWHTRDGYTNIMCILVCVCMCVYAKCTHISIG